MDVDRIVRSRKVREYTLRFSVYLGYDVQIAGPYYPENKYPPTDDMEIVDNELPGGTVQQSEYELEGMGDVTFQRTVYDRDGNLLGIARSVLTSTHEAMSTR